MQYYHISDWKSYPLSFVATLVVGLPLASRTKMRRSTPYELVEFISDIFHKDDEESDVTGFDTAEEFEAVRAKLFGGEN